ncbi:unnamed protein product [Lactuca saligna]|uniref:Uncharacterized protein n=1 Tax=Lactuca saligna TaxID=75948 RepID=A0AA35YLW2_LACSI|nr:unnamed protein product [Lactuca saligna]
MLDHGKHDSSKAKRDQHTEGESQLLRECHTTSDIESDDDQCLFTKRKDNKVEYPQRILVSELVNYGYSEWLQISNIIKSHKGIHAHELKLALTLMINKFKNLNMIPPQDLGSSSTPKPPSVLSRIRMRRSKQVSFLVPFGCVYINNSFTSRISSA